MRTETTEPTRTARFAWQTLLGTGVIIAVVGIIAIFYPFLTGITLSVLFGAALIVSAMVHVVHVFSARDWMGVLWQLILASVYVVVGTTLVVNPIVGLSTLTILAIAFLSVSGVVEIVVGLSIRPASSWAWVVTSGVISLLLAGLLWVGWPASATWSLGLLFGVGLVTSGVSTVAVAIGGRKAARSVVVDDPSERI